MKEELKERTKAFALEVFKNTQKLDQTLLDYKRQLIRCSSSVGANYRAACRAKSTKDFIYKLKSYHPHRLLIGKSFILKGINF